MERNETKRNGRNEMKICSLLACVASVSSFIPLPLHRPFFFFRSRPTFFDELARKRLLRRLVVCEMKNPLENADFKFSVNNEGEDVNKKRRSRRNIA